MLLNIPLLKMLNYKKINFFLKMYLTIIDISKLNINEKIFNYKITISSISFAKSH